MAIRRELLRAPIFWLLERVALPILIYPLRLLVWSWRAKPPEQAALDEMVRSPRLILATCHGMFLHLLAYCQISPRHGRRHVVLLSPSRDGRLLGAVLAHFGFDCVYGTSNSRGVGGAVEFIRRIDAGEVGVIAIDGPRGPCCEAKSGFFRIAQAARADVFLALTSARCGIRFGSWDRAHLPAPFSQVEVALQRLTPTNGDSAAAMAAVQSALIRLAHRIRSPVLPPALARRMPPCDESGDPGRGSIAPSQ